MQGRLLGPINNRRRQESEKNLHSSLSAKKQSVVHLLPGIYAPAHCLWRCCVLFEFLCHGEGVQGEIWDHPDLDFNGVLQYVCMTYVDSGDDPGRFPIPTWSCSLRCMDDLTNNCAEAFFSGWNSNCNNAAMGVCRLLTVMQGGRSRCRILIKIMPKVPDPLRCLNF